MFQPRLSLACALGGVLVGAPLAAAALSHELEAPIDAVTVYRGEAMIGRVGEFRATPGEHQALVRGLPANFDANSLQVKLSGPDGLVMGGVELRETPQAELAGAEEAALDKRLTTARDELQDLLAERESAETALRFIQSLIDGKLTRTSEGATGRLDPDSWKRGWESVGQGALQQRQKVLAAQRKERDQTRRVEALERQLAAVRTDQRSTRTAVVTYRAAREGAVRINLAYLMPKAGWQPAYEARLDTTTGALVVGERAVVSQRTGEDWTAAKLVLSTSAPRASSKAPELGEWRVSAVDPVTRGGAFNRLVQPQAKAMLAPAPAPARQAEQGIAELADAPAREETAQVGGSAFVTEYRIPGQVTVTADGSPRKVSLRETTLAATLAARIVPAVDARAYLVANVRPATSEPLLPGAWMMFRDGALVGEHRRNLVRPGEEIALSFGIDDRIEVKRQTKADTRGERGLVGQRSTVEREWLTTVTNRHQTPMAIELHDRLPVAGHDDIEVEALKTEPPPTTRDLEGKRGVLAWRFELPAGANKSLGFGYRVSWPKELMVPGF